MCQVFIPEVGRLRSDGHTACLYADPFWMYSWSSDSACSITNLFTMSMSPPTVPEVVVEDRYDDSDVTMAGPAENQLSPSSSRPVASAGLCEVPRCRVPRSQPIAFWAQSPTHDEGAALVPAMVHAESPYESRTLLVLSAPAVPM